MAQTGQRVDPYRNFNFLVEIDGIAQASFTECSGLGSTTEVIETPRGRRQHDRPQAAGQDDLHRHHAEVGADRLDRAVGVAPADRRRDGGPQERLHRRLRPGQPRPRWRAGTSSAPGRPSGRGRRSTPRATTSPSTPSCSRTRAWPQGVTVLVTEVDFELPKGYVDAEGNLHRDGVMRLATAADEIYPLKDPRVQNWPAYLIVILLAAGRHPARRPARGQPRASSRACSPRTWRTCRTSTTGSTA